MAERKGASYRITSKRPASSHVEHTQTTQASHYLSGMHLPGIAEAKKTSWDSRYGPMAIRQQEYEQAESGRMSAEEMSRVGIDPRRYPNRRG